MLLPAPYGVWFPNLCETSLSAVDMEVQLGEGELALLLEVGSPARQDEGGPLSARPPGAVSGETLSASDRPLADDHRLVVGHHLVVGHRLVVDRHPVALVVFPACPLCGSIAAPL